MNRAQLHRIHKWIAIAAGGFFLSWMVSGISMILPGSGSEARPRKPDYRTATISPAQAVETAGGDAAEVALARVGGRLVYQLRTRHGLQMVDAHSGEPYRITPEVAEAVVRTDYAPGPGALRTERLEHHDWNYSSGPLPVYRIGSAKSGKRYYVSAQDGSVRIVTPSGRIRSIIGGMHTFSVFPVLSGNGRLRRVALFGAATIGLFAAITGYVIALPRGRRKVSR